MKQAYFKRSDSMLKWLLIGAMALLPTLSTAQNIQVWDTMMGGDTMGIGSSFVHWDKESFDVDGDLDAGYSSIGYEEYQMNDRVYLELLQTLDSCFPDSFELWVDVEIRSRGLDTILSTDTIRLTVRNDTSIGRTNAEIASYVFNDKYWFEVTVVGYSDITLLKYVDIHGEYEIERYRELDTSAITFGNVILDDSTGEIALYWDTAFSQARAGCVGYELEWTWLDAFDDDGDLLDPTAVIVDFRHDHSRVKITANSYRISPAYEAGYLVFRVRPVGVNKYKIDQPVYGDYSNTSYGDGLDSYSENKDYVKLDSPVTIQPLDRLMNWQYSATYAEGGKKKEVISYYDGSLRNRQSVTRINFNGILESVVGETVYDYEGRPAVNILPVPAFDRTLDFHPAFNISNATNQTYSKNDFDSIPGESCTADVTSLSTSSGASNYYSDQNDSVNNRSFGFIPDAHGYPMTVTQYTPDGTGRIKRQSGVGPDHQLGSGHETKYYYATPGEQELDRLFGNDVGFVEHYQKEMVVDPNGQVSVSYKDLSGKVIATSLAGDSPDSMEALASEPTAPVILTQFVESDYNASTYFIMSNKSIVVPGDSSRYDIKYDLQIPRYKLDSIPSLCFDCVYDLRISLLDECGNEVLDGDAASGNQAIVRRVGMVSDFDVSCDSAVLSYNFDLDNFLNDSTLTVYLDQGSYSLHKSLFINNNAYDYYLEQLLNSDELKTLEEFEAEAIAEQDTGSCYWSCDECLDSLGSYTDYKNSRLTELSELNYSGAQIDAITLQEFDALKLTCEGLCAEPVSTCESIYTTLLMDVMPGGQYFPLPDSATGEMPDQGIFELTTSNEIGFSYKSYKDGASWYDMDYKDADDETILFSSPNGAIELNELTPKEFYQNHDLQWSRTLVKYHPEYCLYEFCVTNDTSYAFNTSMDSIRTFDEALAAGMLNPLNQSGLVQGPSWQDPYFSEVANATDKTNFIAALDSFAQYGITGGCRKLKPLELALVIHYSEGDISTCQELDDFLDYYLPLDTLVMCDQRADLVWQTFRGFYLSEKEEFLKDMPKCTVTIPDGYVARFPDTDDILTETGTDITSNDNDEIHDDAEDAVLAKCDTICDNQAEYWLEKLGGCSLSQATQDSLMDAFKAICKNGCDGEHPWGASNYPHNIGDRVSVPVADSAHSFEEAFNKIVPASKRNLAGCDVWTISFPFSYNRTYFKLAGLDSSCIIDAIDLDSCYSDATSDNQLAMIYSNSLDSSMSCEECITCDEFQEALDSLANKYGGVFIDSTYELTEVLTNFMNSYLGFNLGYWDYKDFQEECYQIGNLSANESFGSVSKEFQSLLDVYRPPMLPSLPSLDPFKRSNNVDYTTFASSQGSYFYPETQLDLMVQSPTDKYVDTCICNKLADYLDDFGVNEPDAKDRFLDGTATGSDHTLFEDYLDLNWCEGSSAITTALETCIGILQDVDSTDLTPSATWSQHAYNALMTYVANEGIKVPGSGLECFPNCDGNHPGEANPFFNENETGPYDNVFFSSTCLDCPDCDSLEHTMTATLLEHFGYDTTDIDTQQMWQDYRECFLTSICEVMNSNTEWLCQNCSPSDSISGESTHEIEDIYEALWDDFNSDYTTIWETTAMMSGNGKNVGDSIIPWEDTLDAKEKMKLIMQMYGKCIYLPCNYCYPSCPTETCEPSCCKDTTIYFYKLQAFFNDFTSNRGFLGNHFAYTNWAAYPSITNYYSSPLYQNSCHTSIRYRLIENKMPTLNFVLEDDCQDKFYVNLGYLYNYLNQANFARIVSFDSIAILPDPEPASCLGTNKFAILASQLDANGDTIEVELLGSINKFEVYSAMPDGIYGCSSPSLCNRALGTAYRERINPCVSEKLMRGYAVAKRRYNDYIDSIESDFKQSYYSTCMGAIDTMEINYDLKEYHYTLYYYDQAGNLIQTVPPQGVDILTSANDLDQVKTYRELGTGSAVYPTHTLETRYRYNTLNEVRWQNTPDADSSRFWYDRLGRMAISQNEKQRPNNLYSYTEYDSLGRIHQVGQINNATGMTSAIAFDTSQLYSWIENGVKAQITTTWYDTTPVDLTSQGFAQQNLRNRVTAMAFYESAGEAYQHAVFYDYDIHGNVESLLREIPELHFIEQGYKIVNYDYDLVSGNVNFVNYQQSEFDRFTHKYLYDADNRLEDVYTTVDDVHWDRDAHYHYYMHGPLRRLELGDNKVQGVDYAYTLHGWLKGVNSTTLLTSRDLGQDGESGTLNEKVAKDVFGFSLHYYHEDYDPINDLNESPDDYFLINDSSGVYKNSVRQLYNGNISRMVTALGQFSSVALGKAYEYDQLNRISAAISFTNYESTNNYWKTSGSGGGEHRSDYTYDANGNILSLSRNDEVGNVIDHLSYNYESGTNKLTYVDDTVSSGSYSYDIDDQSSGNYQYDAIGNMISDAAEEIETIEWTVYGKIKSITRTSGSTKPNLTFEYSPDGHRAAKHVIDSLGNTTSTWYVRDASGNILATYSRNWEVHLDTSNLTEDDIYSVVKTDKSLESRLTYFDEAFNWVDYVPSSQLDQLETNLVASMLQRDFLDHFSAIEYMSDSIFDILVNGTSDTALVSIIRSNENDEFIAGLLCDSCATDYITAMLTSSYSDFLNELVAADVILFDHLVDTLGILNTLPTPDKISEIISNSTIANTTSLIINHGFDCSGFTSILDVLVSLNTSNSQMFFDSVANFKSCMTDNIDQSLLMQYFQDYHGNDYMWDKNFYHAPGTEDDVVGEIKDNLPSEFLMYSVLELGSSDMDETVAEFSGSSISHWLETILSHYGASYYNHVVGQYLPDNNLSYWSFSLEEHHMYGSSRLGVKKRHRTLYEQPQEGVSWNYISTDDDTLYKYSYLDDSLFFCYRGETYYELSNHLGNVLAVITDRKIQTCGAGEIMYYKAQIVSVQDYYPFGMQIQSRSYIAPDKGYGFGFNGMEKDDEVKGTGNSVDFGARIYDSRLGRWLSTDPMWVRFPGLSTFNFAKNCPVFLVDTDGNTFHITAWSSSETQRNAFKQIIEARFDNLVNVNYVKSSYQFEYTYLDSKTGETKIGVTTIESYEPRITINEVAVREFVKSAAQDDVTDGEIDWLVKQQIKKIEEGATYAYLDELFNEQTTDAHVSLQDNAITGSYRTGVINASSIANGGKFAFSVLYHEVTEQAAKAQGLFLDGQGLIKGNGYPSAHYFAFSKQVEDLNSQNENGTVVAVLTGNGNDNPTNHDVTMTVYTEVRENTGKGCCSKITGYRKTVYEFIVTKKKFDELVKVSESSISKTQMDSDIAKNKAGVNKAGAKTD